MDGAGQSDATSNRSGHLFYSVFLDRAARENPSSALAQSTSGLNSQTSHHTAAEHNVTHVGVCPAPSQDLQLRQD